MYDTLTTNIEGIDFLVEFEWQDNEEGFQYDFVGISTVGDICIPVAEVLWPLITCSIYDDDIKGAIK